MALAGLAVNPSLCVRIIGDGAIPLLVALAKRESDDTPSQRFAVTALSNLAMSRAAHDALVDAQVMRMVVQVRPVMAMCIRACGFMRVRMHRAVARVRRRGGCGRGGHRSGASAAHSEMHIVMARTQVNFAVAPENHALLLGEYVLGPLVRLCLGPADDGAAAARPGDETDEHVVVSAAMSARRAQALAARGLRGLAVDARSRAQIVAQGGMHALLRLAATGGSAAGTTDALCSPTSVQADVLAALTNLAICGCIADFASAFAASLPVSVLLGFLESTDARKVSSSSSSSSSSAVIVRALERPVTLCVRACSGCSGQSCWGTSP